jgi:hypothetical protein
MPKVTDSTSIESSNVEWAGVPAGAKMFVGDSRDPLPATREEFCITASKVRSEIRHLNEISDGRSENAKILSQKIVLLASMMLPHPNRLHQSDANKRESP